MIGPRLLRCNLQRLWSNFFLAATLSGATVGAAQEDAVDKVPQQPTTVTGRLDPVEPAVADQEAAPQTTEESPGAQQPVTEPSAPVLTAPSASGPVPDHVPSATPPLVVPAAAPSVGPAHVAPSSPSAVPAPPALDSGWSWVETVGTPRQEREGATPAKKLAFRGSGFTWGHAATTSLLGVGTDYISTSHQIYEQSYTLLLNYFAYEGDKIDLRLVTTPGMDVELTNSDVTTTYREPLFRDLPVSAILSARLAEHKAHLLSTSVSGNLTLIAPTSKMSYSAGHYLTVSPRLGVSQQIPLLGRGAAVLSDMELAGQVRFDHLFSRAAIAVNPRLKRTRRSALGIGTLSNVLNGSQIAPNSLRFEVFATFTEKLLGRPLNLLVGGEYTTAALYGIGSTEVKTATGTTEVAADPSARTWRRSAGVGLEVTYHVTDPLSLAVGYANSADLGSSESPNPLYTPYAVFLAGVTLHLDAAFQFLSGQEVAHPPEFDPSQAKNNGASYW